MNRTCKTDKNGADASLRSLSRRKQLAFALLLSERMFPLLALFSKTTGYDLSVYLKGRKAAWGAVSQAKIRKNLAWRGLSQECLKSAPDTESYAGPLVSYALNAVLSLANILTFNVDRNVEHVVEVIGLARDSVDMYIQSSDPSPISGPDTAELEGHPLMQEEYKRELQDAQFLATLPENIDEETISKLRSRAEAQPPLLPLKLSD